MSQDDVSPEGEPAEEAGPPLKTSERWIAGIVGFLMIGAGTAAVFLRKVEAGPTALITLGALLTVIAISGVSIKRARIGDNEILLHNRQAAAIEIANTPAEDLDSALGVLAAYDPGAVTDPAIQMALAAAYDSAMKSKLREAFGGRYISGGRISDGLIDLPNGRVHVEIRHFSRAEGDHLRFRYQKLTQSPKIRDMGDQILIVLNVAIPEPMSAKAEHRALAQGQILKTVTLSSMHTPDEVRELISQEFSSASA
ncbi:hypothetical protein I6J39_34705 (plasmid) [Streptomyces californicus]|uniref:Uncharacterized protein n=1 Tax=Streptomyces californicus TaxID=67351 RepID=A0ABX7JCJ8_9ACTN|nr:MULTISPECIES: hypothetical protein [Streptomyces]QRV32504.1 hypothetical protein I6J39_34705 [Streptomyces californicus]QRV45919.1 hypothetical protein I6J41_34630 [Streptomyces californicus]